ncbi:NfeD family protein [Cellvibrio sp. PSBB006]|uniref:NfeD family protein n=1 Tax=Cellvibrio sp. PSBB006 TaxID=1987723 RepID=UPI000B3B9706|nr:NfeD family protein [Cellvibrio sp. PSBB006]ARU27170.1 nodulation efficiency family protein [Cellvibrio sp. PSBB006]
MEFLASLEPWHWLSLGMLILILEILGAGGFLLGIGVSALIIAVVLAIFPGLAWFWQFILFATLSIVITLVYWKKFRKFNNKTDQPLLNSRAARLVGRSVSLLTPIQNGTGKVQIEDALWTVACTDDLPQGTIVDIVGADGMTLLVKLHDKSLVVKPE